jgi:phosphohistidine phosphatase SixA
MADPAEVERILAAGADRARETLAPLMDDVRNAVGIR